MIKFRNLLESNNDTIEKVIKGFGLVRYPKGFGQAYVTKNGKATPQLAKRINIFIQKLNDPITKVAFEKNYETINFI